MGAGTAGITRSPLITANLVRAICRGSVRRQRLARGQFASIRSPSLPEVSRGTRAPAFKPVKRGRHFTPRWEFPEKAGGHLSNRPAQPLRWLRSGSVVGSPAERGLTTDDPHPLPCRQARSMFRDAAWIADAPLYSSRYITLRSPVTPPSSPSSIGRIRSSYGPS